MNKPILIAALVSAATFGLHVVGGGAEFHQPIQASSMALPLRAISAILWHAVSMLLVLQAAALMWLAHHPNPALSLFIAVVQIGFAALFLFYGVTMIGSVWVLGQWVIFVAIAALVLWGIRPTAQAGMR